MEEIKSITKQAKNDSIFGENEYPRIISKLQKSTYAEAYALACMQFGHFLFEKSLYNRAFNNFNKARVTYNKLNDSIHLADAALHVAISHYHRGNYRFSARNFVESMEIADKLKLHSIVSEASEYLGLLYNASQNFNSSSQSYQKSLKLKADLKDWQGYSRVALKLSEIYRDMMKYDSSLIYANEAQRISEEKNLPNYVYYACIEKIYTCIVNGSLRECKNEISTIEKYLAEEVKDVQRSRKGDLNIVHKSYTLMGNVALIQSNPGLMKLWHDKTHALIERSKYPEISSFLYKSLADTYRSMGNYNLAFENQAKYIKVITESLTPEDKKNFESIEDKYSLQKNEDEIKWLNAENKLKQLQLLRQAELALNLKRENILMDSILESQNELSTALQNANKLQNAQLKSEREIKLIQDQKLSQEKRIRNLLIGSLLLLLCLSSLSFVMYRKAAQKNIIIQRQANELQTLMKEIHHRVKNNLQIVSSLLNLQANHIQDKDAIMAVKESKNRVLSIALIHQRLYQETDLRNVELREYIENLCKHLISSYSNEASFIQIERDIDPLILEEDIIMPLGLILNELVTNSIKYAFPDKKSGNIKIWIRKINKTIVMKVKDNGVGLNVDLIKNEKTFGFKMIKSFLQKLKGEIDITNNQGTEVTIKFDIDQKT